MKVSKNGAQLSLEKLAIFNFAIAILSSQKNL